jgi:hypothetical protein
MDFMKFTVLQVLSRLPLLLVMMLLHLMPAAVNDWGHSRRPEIRFSEGLNQAAACKQRAGEGSLSIPSPCNNDPWVINGPFCGQRYLQCTTCSCSALWRSWSEMDRLPFFGKMASGRQGERKESVGVI